MIWNKILTAVVIYKEGKDKNTRILFIGGGG
jgi:hypothetical protein